MGVFLILALIVIGTLLVGKLTNEEGWFFATMISSVIMLILGLVLWGGSVDHERFLMRYEAGVCHYHYNDNVEILHHRQFHDSFMVGIFFSEEIANLELLTSESCR